MTTNPVRRILATTVLVLAGTLSVLSAGPAQASSAEVTRRGSCSGSTHWKLKAKPDDGRIEVEAEIDSNQASAGAGGCEHNGSVSARGTPPTPPAARSGRAPAGQPAPAPTPSASGRATRAPARCAWHDLAGDSRRPRHTGAPCPRRERPCLGRPGGPVPGHRAPALRRAARRDRGPQRARRSRRGPLRRPRDHRGAGPLGGRAGDPARARRRGRRGGRPLRPGGRSTGCWCGDVRRIKIWRARRHDRLLRRDPADRRAVPARRRGASTCCSSGGTRGRGLRPRPAGEPVRDQGRAACRGLHPDAVARGRAAAVRGLLLGRRRSTARQAQVFDAVPPDHPRRPARVLVAVATADAVGADPPADPGRGRARAAAAQPPSTPPTPSAAGSPATCTTAWCRTSPARRSRSRRWPGEPEHRARAARRLDPTAPSLRDSACARCARCSSRSTRPSLRADGLAAALEDLTAPARAAGVDRRR